MMNRVFANESGNQWDDLKMLETKIQCMVGGCTCKS